MANVKETKLPVRLLTERAFKPFGDVLTQPIGIKPTAASEILECWDIAKFDTDKPMSIIFMKLSYRSLLLKNLERHLQTQEMMIPISGHSILPVAPPSKSNDPKALPPINRVDAFLLRPEKAVLLDPGVWHWAPFPISENASFIVIVKSGTVEEDLDFRNLEKACNISFRLDFEKIPSP